MLITESLARTVMDGRILSFDDYERLSRMVRGGFKGAAGLFGSMAALHRLAAAVMAPTPLGLIAREAVQVENAWATFLSHYAKDVARIPLRFDGLTIDGDAVDVTERAVYDTPFGHLTHLARTYPDGSPLTRRDPPLVIVVPHSGHRASLLQETITTMIRDHEVYYIEMNDANEIPMRAGAFDYHDYIDFARHAMEAAGKHSAAHGGPKRVNIMAVCQPGPPVFAAAMIMATQKNPYRPRSLAALASPFDTRISPTPVNIFARTRDMEWFEQNVIYPVPRGYGYEGEGRAVYPGYLQRAGFIAKSIDSHIDHTKKFHDNLVAGNDADARTKMAFDDVFLFDIASLTAEFYLQTVKYNFKEDHLPRGVFEHRGVPITGKENRDIALITLEGEKDDVTGLGQTQSVHDLCPRLPASMKHHLMIPDAGHYSVFSRGPFQKIAAPWLKSTLENGVPNTYDGPPKHPPVRHPPDVAPRQKIL